MKADRKKEGGNRLKLASAARFSSVEFQKKNPPKTGQN